MEGNIICPVLSALSMFEYASSSRFFKFSKNTNQLGFYPLKYKININEVVFIFSKELIY